jgi:hypothetical protein
MIIFSIFSLNNKEITYRKPQVKKKNIEILSNEERTQRKNIKKLYFEVKSLRKHQIRNKKIK